MATFLDDRIVTLSRPSETGKPHRKAELHARISCGGTVGRQERSHRTAYLYQGAKIEPAVARHHPTATARKNDRPMVGRRENAAARKPGGSLGLRWGIGRSEGRRQVTSLSSRKVPISALGRRS